MAQPMRWLLVLAMIGPVAPVSAEAHVDMAAAEPPQCPYERARAERAAMLSSASLPADDSLFRGQARDYLP